MVFKTLRLPSAMSMPGDSCAEYKIVKYTGPKLSSRLSSRCSEAIPISFDSSVVLCSVTYIGCLVTLCQSQPVAQVIC